MGYSWRYSWLYQSIGYEHWYFDGSKDLFIIDIALVAISIHGCQWVCLQILALWEWGMPHGPTKGCPLRPGNLAHLRCFFTFLPQCSSIRLYSRYLPRNLYLFLLGYFPMMVWCLFPWCFEPFPILLTAPDPRVVVNKSSPSLSVSCPRLFVHQREWNPSIQGAGIIHLFTGPGWFFHAQWIGSRETS